MYLHRNLYNLKLGQVVFERGTPPPGATGHPSRGGLLLYVSQCPLLSSMVATELGQNLEVDEKLSSLGFEKVSLTHARPRAIKMPARGRASGLILLSQNFG